MKCPNCHVNDLEPIMIENMGMGFGKPAPEGDRLIFSDEPIIEHAALTVDDNTHGKRKYGMYECSNCGFVSIKRER